MKNRRQKTEDRKPNSRTGVSPVCFAVLCLISSLSLAATSSNMDSQVVNTRDLTIFGTASNAVGGSYVASITITNTANLTNKTVVINGVTLAWKTNATLAALQIGITNSTAQSATNLFGKLPGAGLGNSLLNSISFSIFTNTVKVTGTNNTTVSMTATGHYAIVTITTNAPTLTAIGTGGGGSGGMTAAESNAFVKVASGVSTSQALHTPTFTGNVALTNGFGTSSGTTNLATILATGPNPGNMGGLIQSNGTLDNVTLNNSFITNGAVRVCLQFQDILSGSVLPLQLTNTHFTTFNGASWLTLWDSGNDGTGSGLDADLLDGLDSLQLATAAALFTATNANFVAIHTAVSNNFVIKTGGTASNLAVAGAYSGNGTAQVHTTSLYGGLAYKPYATPPLSQNNTWWAFTNIAGAFVPEYSLYVMGMDVLGRRFVLLGNQTPVGNTDTFNAEVDSDWIMHIAFGSVAPLNEDARFTIAGLLNKAPLGLKHYRGAPTEYIVTLETNAAVAVQTQWIIEGNHKWAFGTVDGTNIVGIAPLAFVGAGLNTINGYMGPTNFIFNMYTGLVTTPGMNAGTITASGTITALNIPGSGIITNNHNSAVNLDATLTVNNLTVDVGQIVANAGITGNGSFTLSGNLVYPRLVLTASTNFTALSMVSNTWFVCDTTSGNQSNVFGTSANNAGNNLGGLGGIKWFSSTNLTGTVILDGGTTTFQFTDTGTRYLTLNCPFTVGIQLHKIAPNPRASVIGGSYWGFGSTNIVSPVLNTAYLPFATTRGSTVFCTIQLNPAVGGGATVEALTWTSGATSSLGRATFPALTGIGTIEQPFFADMQPGASIMFTNLSGSGATAALTNLFFNLK